MKTAHDPFWNIWVQSEFKNTKHVVRLEKVERKMLEHDQKFDLLIKASLPSNEGIFYDGQLFDAWEFVYQLVKSARHSITLIDNYVDESVLRFPSLRRSFIWR